MHGFFKKAHKWVGICLALLIILFSLSGIILNHRSLFSQIDVNRSVLPTEYHYKNWNNAAVRSVEKKAENELLVYGNIGIWLTDSSFTRFRDFNNGFPAGIDNRKIFKVLATKNQVLAGTLFGLYGFSDSQQQWLKISLPNKEENVVDLLEKGDSIFILTRSNLLVSTDLKTFHLVKLPPPENYDNKIGLFKTLWVIHSGEIYGTIGKLVVDAVALIFILLSIGGVVLFFSKRRMKSWKISINKRKSMRKRFLWHLKWHNKIGWITAVILLGTTITGMFLRPPMLIAIAETRVKKIPFTELSTPNPWFDILRRIIYLPEEEKYLVSTSEGFYTFDKEFSKEANRVRSQPPASVMGVTVLEKVGNHQLMVGSFEGLFAWDYETDDVFDLIKQIPYVRPLKKGPPVGDHKISGYTTYYKDAPVVFDYYLGATDINQEYEFPAMPNTILDQAPISLWNVALEFHTGRIYQAILGRFYILVVPLGGILILLTLISGFVILFKLKYRRKSKL